MFVRWLHLGNRSAPRLAAARKPKKRAARPKLVYQFLVVLSGTNPLVYPIDSFRLRSWLHLIQCSLMGTREKRIGIRELKSTLSECVREVRAGRTIVVTDHGQPVARIIPEGVSLRERIEALKRAGTIAWSGRRLRPAKPAGKVRGAKTVADLVVENRE